MTRTANDFSLNEWLKLRVALLGAVMTNEDTDLTVRDLAKRLKVPQSIILDLAEDQPGLDITIGYNCGGGHFLEKNLADYMIEFNDPDNDYLVDDFDETGKKKIQFIIDHMNFKNYAKVEI